jgi:hypothetical protein
MPDTEEMGELGDEGAGPDDGEQEQELDDEKSESEGGEA